MTASRMMMFLLSKAPPLQGRGWGGGGIHLAQDSRAHPVATIEQARKSHCPSPEGEGRILSDEELADPFGDQRRLVLALDLRSEEHTSELKSLMRISYAVFCLQQKHNTQPHNNIH